MILGEKRTGKGEERLVGNSTGWLVNLHGTDGGWGCCLARRECRARGRAMFTYESVTDGLVGQFGEPTG